MMTMPLRLRRTRRVRWLPMVNMGGKDCTDVFANYHPARVYKTMLPAYYLGRVTDYHESKFVQVNLAPRSRPEPAGNERELHCPFFHFFSKGFIFSLMPLKPRHTTIANTNTTPTSPPPFRAIARSGNSCSSAGCSRPGPASTRGPTPGWPRSLAAPYGSPWAAKASRLTSWGPPSWPSSGSRWPSSATTPATTP